MKTLQNTLVVLAILLLISCAKTKENGTNKNKSVAPKEIPIVNVTKSYPKKEIVLQDIAEVEYVPLETRANFLVDEKRVLTYASQNTIIIHNKKLGDILLFEGNGKVLNKFNRRGQSGREYTYGYKAFYDKNAKELFIVDVYGKRKRRLLVYDIEGKYKRTLFTELKNIRTLEDYDKGHCFLYEHYADISKKVKKKNLTPFILLSKETGKLDTLKQIKLKDRVNQMCFKYFNKYNVAGVSFTGRHIIPLSEEMFVLNDYYADTIFLFSKKQQLMPLCVRKPPIKEHGETNILTSIINISRKWLFLDVQLQEYDFKKRKAPKPTFLSVNRETNSINEYQLRNRDISETSFEVMPKTTLLNAGDLVELLEEGKLKGKLKAIAENLKEDDNPVLMKVTLKK
ncbi:MAG: hypothetical protein CSB01_02715 [Bacteroidia bacterium]|nr:MAG: hypothetical protein CSB01_02715 [Bacteroidia bacterium]